MYLYEMRTLTNIWYKSLRMKSQDNTLERSMLHKQRVKVSVTYKGAYQLCNAHNAGNCVTHNTYYIYTDIT